MVNCKLNKLILVSNATIYYYYMQEVFSFKKRHTSQLYYDGLLLSNMCYYCYKHCYKAILTRSVSYFGTTRTISLTSHLIWPKLWATPYAHDAPLTTLFFFFFYRDLWSRCA